MRITVIGAGLLGLSTAYVLQERNHEVIVLDACEGVGFEASYKNGGILTPSMSDPWNAPGVFKHLASSVFDPQSAMKLHLSALPSLFSWGLKFLWYSRASHYHKAVAANYRLAAFSVQKTRELRERLGLSYDAATRGSVKLFREKTAMQAPEALAESLKPLGLQFNKLDADGVIAMEPQLAAIKNQIAGALHFPDDECGDAHIFCQHLAEQFKKGGGVIRTNVSAKRLVTQSGKIVGVETNHGMIEVDNIVVAAGVHSPELLNPMGIALPIKPAKGYSITLSSDAIGASIRKTLPQFPVIDDALHMGVIPLGDRLRLVGTAEFAGFDKQVCQKNINSLFNLFDQLYPHLADHIDKTKTEKWVGFRPMSADGKPFIGPTKIQGLFVNAGHGHLGWTMAIGSAYLLADQIENKKSAIDPKSYNLNQKQRVNATLSTVACPLAEFVGSTKGNT